MKPVNCKNLELCKSLQKISAKKIQNIFDRISNEVQKLTNDKLRLMFDDERYLSVILIEKTYGGDWFVLESYSSLMINKLSEKYKIIYGLIEFFEELKRFTSPGLHDLNYAKKILTKLSCLKSIFESNSYEELEIQMTLMGI